MSKPVKFADFEALWIAGLKGMAIERAGVVIDAVMKPALRVEVTHANGETTSYHADVTFSIADWRELAESICEELKVPN